ncbi:E3 ubiquitin-protein ligase RAD18 [Entomortierella parvispora]|uniref:RING-type E3 ubiquitin transferase n=1 Tax=Entomortierella parvispora TaxID=205924 RepID=A0A9P3LW52_9FUNG|nr:E3 ubiquitin-protein ligase RAD18 [Entomortierella parvispora]
MAASTSQMRRNVALDEIANHFGDCRARLLKVVTSTDERPASDTSMEIAGGVRQQKRRRVSGRITPKSSQEPMDLDSSSNQRSSSKKSNDDDDDDFSVSSQDSGNSRREEPALRRSGRTSTLSTPVTDSVLQSTPISGRAFPSSSSSSEPTVAATPLTPTTPTKAVAKHTLVACPVCECAIPEAQTNSHLDKFCFAGKKDPIYTLPYNLLMGHLTEAKAIELYERVGYPAAGTNVTASSTKSSSTQPTARTQSIVNPFGQSSPRSQYQTGNASLFGSPSKQPVPVMAKPIPPEPKRIPKLTYSVLNDKQLRKKLSELGLAVHGDKQLMQKRHAEYVTIYNANCDSTRPLSEAQLRRNMEIWERTYDQDIAAKEQLKRNAEQQRLIQQRELVQKQAAVPQSSVSSTANPSDSSSSASTSSRPFSRSSSGSNFVPNHNNNAEVNVAVAEASAFAHALKYAAEYKELIADIRSRNEKDKVPKKETKQDNKKATPTGSTKSSQSSQSGNQPRASTPANTSSSTSGTQPLPPQVPEQTASQSSITSSQSSSIVEDQPSSQSSQYSMPLTPSKLRHPRRPIEHT